jgi:hypothetical protein
MDNVIVVHEDSLLNLNEIFPDEKFYLPPIEF